MWVSTGGITVALTYSYTDEALVAKDETGKVLGPNNGGGPTFENTYTVETLAGPVDERVPVKTVSTTEYGSKITTGKWGNADIIKVLVQSGFLPQKGKTPFLAGWSLVVVYDATGVPAMYIRHTDKTSIPADDVLSIVFDESGVEARAKSEKTVDTEFSPLTGEPPPPTTVHTLSETFKTRAMATVPFVSETPGDPPIPLDLQGLLSGGGKITVKTFGSGIDKVFEEVYVPGAVKLDKILGTSDLGDIIEGTISVGAAAVVDLNLFMPPQ
ncbi:hypothetical protein BGE01nite_40480 [Brevifollis gellanilyticus]|uniref:Uncharacterized protein n=2 Tax=Brevifollis gellanilyticus TaxID=748831 RepID=A0A512MDE8_9BACT|nr:hypothetical protein BGE01nite_40480 [Brevifollis gellanilyticus]